MADSYKVFDKSPIIDDAVSIHGYSFKKREFALGGVAIVALVVCVILAALLASAKTGRGGGTVIPAEVSCPQVAVKNLCLSPTCMKSAAYVLENVNLTVDPCTNFFQYSCGTWALNNPLKPDVSQLTPSWNIYYKNQERLRTIMETASSRVSEWATERKLKDFFKSCTNHYGKMILKGNPFLRHIVDKIGGWYGIDTFNATTFDFEKALQFTHVDFWTNAFFTFSVRTDWLDWRKMTIQIDLSGTGLSWIYYVRPDAKSYIEDYKKFMRKVATFLIRDFGNTYNETETTLRIDTFVDDAFGVEYALANITKNSDPTADPHAHANRKTLKQLNEETDSAIDWVAFFTYMFDTAGVTEDTTVVVLEADFIKKMAQYIKSGIGENRQRKLNNYLVWRLAHNYVQDLSWDYIHANREFYVDMTGEAEFLGTFRYCMSLVDKDLGEALSSLFVKNHFSDANKNKADEIADYLKDAIVDSLSGNRWMDDTTRRIAQKKMHDSVYKMGYPDMMLNDAQLDNIYGALKVNKLDYFGNKMNINKFHKTDWNRRLRKGTDKSEWSYNTYSVVVEYYNPWKELIVPAGVLQWPLYDHKLPHYMNFGALGATLGHHLIHAIDEYGGQYDPSGKQRLNWWTNSTLLAFRKVKECVIRAYMNQTMGPFFTRLSPTHRIDIPINPRQYAPEALAETSGVRLAFKAFKAWEKANAVEKTAPGMHHTNEQMFFISYAQSNCYNRNGNEAFSQAAGGTVQENVKVNMALSQVPEFQQAFKCSKDSNMVAKTICTMY